jgi:hypothetical protein
MVSLFSYKHGYKEDWNNLTREVEAFSQDRADLHARAVEAMREQGFDCPDDPKAGYVRIRKLKPEVIEWLENNVEDYEGGKGWCVGSDEYIVGDSSTSLSVFLQRRKDAMNFIKTWSKYKKPINYCQYFTDVRKRLNLETLKYEIIQ